MINVNLISEKEVIDTLESGDRLLVLRPSEPEGNRLKTIEGDNLPSGVTQEYVDIGDADTLAAANLYTDNAIASLPSGGISGNEFYIHDCEDGTNVSGIGTAQLLNSLTNPDTGVAYTNASAATKFPYAATVYGTINVATFTYDDVVVMEAFQKATLLGRFTMLKSSATKTYNYKKGGFLIANEKATPNSTIDSKIFIIDMQGARFVYSGAAVAHTCFKKSVTLAELPTALDRTLVFKNVNIDGDGTAGSIGMQIVGGRSCLFENIEIKDYATGFHGGSLLQSKWKELRTSACEIGFHGSIDLVSGASAAEAVWQPILDNCRFRGITTTCIGMKLEGVEFPEMNKIGFEGSDMLHAIYYDNKGNSVAKKISIIRPRMEINSQGFGTFTGAAFKITGTDYQLVEYYAHELQIANHNSEPAFTLLDVESKGGTVMVVMKNVFGNNSNNLWKLKSTDTPASSGYVAWDFENVHLQGNPTTAAQVVDTVTYPNIWVGDPPSRTVKISPRTL